MARSHFVLGGRDFDVGSKEESLALSAFRTEQATRFTQTQAIVTAIEWATNSIVSALTDSDSSPSPDKLNDIMSNLRGLLMPDMAEDKEDKAQEAWKKMKSEIDKGPFQVEGMQYNSGKRKR